MDDVLFAGDVTSTLQRLANRSRLSGLCWPTLRTTERKQRPSDCNTLDLNEGLDERFRQLARRGQCNQIQTRCLSFPQQRRRERERAREKCWMSSSNTFRLTHIQPGKSPFFFCSALSLMLCVLSFSLSIHAFCLHSYREKAWQGVNHDNEAVGA